MRKALFLSLFLLLIFTSTFSAEISGTISTGSGITGDVKISGQAYLPDGAECSTDSECYSSHCSIDYDGTGSWCAPSDSCAHDGVIYSNGSSLCYGDIKETCNNGSWVSEVCSAGCSNGNCQSPLPSPTSAPSGGGGGGGGAPSPGVEETPAEEETIFYGKYTYTPSKEELKSILEEAGYSEDEIKKMYEYLDNIEITKELDVKKITTAEGAAKYKSTFTITVRNKSTYLFRNVSIVESISKDIVSDASQIFSDTNFKILVKDPVIEWTIEKLSPGEVAKIDYWIDKNLSEEDINKSKTAFFAETTEVVEELLSTIEVTVKTPEGKLIEEPVTVKLFSKGQVIETLSTSQGKCYFRNLKAGIYTIRVPETEKYKPFEMEVNVGVGKTLKVTITLEAKAVPTTPVATTPPATTPPKTVATPPLEEEKPKLNIIVLIAIVFVIVIIWYLATQRGKVRQKPKGPEPKSKKRRWAHE